jgi:hypothetical protein
MNDKKPCLLFYTGTVLSRDLRLDLLMNLNFHEIILVKGIKRIVNNLV